MVVKERPPHVPFICVFMHIYSIAFIIEKLKVTCILMLTNRVTDHGKFQICKHVSSSRTLNFSDTATM
jgi:hypothetical protein